LAFVIYYSVFAIHFAILTNSGPGDAFMSARFQKTLVGSQFANNPTVSSEGNAEKFVEMNVEMMAANVRLDATHPYSSKWYTWPIMQRDIFYWQGDRAPDSTDPRGYIYLLGNPEVYWLGSASALFLIILWLVTKVWRKNERIASLPGLKQDPHEFKFKLFFIVFGYLINFLPFIFIGRVMFLYHYEAALLFSVMALAMILDFIQVPKMKLITSIILVIIALGLFIYFSPLTYGTTISDQTLMQRMWLPSWR
jgi:dolichyl-phosphate-mannose--protein O-mannosyl transferase